VRLIRRFAAPGGIHNAAKRANMARLPRATAPFHMNSILD
jgi:hypothetical protein